MRKALQVTERHVAFLLRLAIVASEGRRNFWEQHPPRQVIVLPQRPSYTGGGTDQYDYGFFWWDLEYDGPTEMRWLPKWR